MAKYSYQFKKEIVIAYKTGEGGKEYLAKKYGVKSSTDIMKWVKAYEAFGDEGIMRSRRNQKYSFEFKLSVVELYLTTETSYQELALSNGVNNPPLISKWVNDYRIAGPDALREKVKGRKLTMAKPKKEELTDKNAEYLKQLESENLQLRIENAYLKELRRLRLEDEARLRERLESFTASEESSD